MNLLGESAHVGRHCGSNQYTATPDVIAFYADALDDHNPLYSEVAPPLLYHSECYKFVGEWYLKNLFGNLHAQQDWEFFAPIPVGSKVRTRSTIIDRWSKRGRDYVVNETDVCAADDGRLLVRGRTHQSFLPASLPPSLQASLQVSLQAKDPASAAATEFVVDRSTAKTKPARPPFPTATGADLSPVKKLVDQRRCWMFSGPGKNYHTDREQAAKLGFPNIVVQGMMSTSFVAQVMADQFGMGFIAGGKMQLKLINVLWVDETVTTYAKVREESAEGSDKRIHCDVWVEKDDGTRIALGQASALDRS